MFHAILSDILQFSIKIFEICNESYVNQVNVFTSYENWKIIIYMT